MGRNIISIGWLKQHLHDPDLVILNASQPENKNPGNAHYYAKQIPNARYFDLNNVFSDKENPLPHMLPDAASFQKECRHLGIFAKSHIVVYDNTGVYMSPRVWWMFKVMGHKNVAVLNGGMPLWVKKGFPTEAFEAGNYVQGDFVANFNPKAVSKAEHVLENIQSGKALVMDARSSGRFKGTEPEPRVGLPSGHIPKSVNLPFTEVLHEGKFKPREKLKELFKSLNPENNPVIFTCGSGVTACILYLANELAGKIEKSVFDGSWTEWVQHKDHQIHQEINKKIKDSSKGKAEN